jgi:hypothetical protein
MYSYSKLATSNFHKDVEMSQIESFNDATRRARALCDIADIYLYFNCRGAVLGELRLHTPVRCYRNVDHVANILKPSPS